MWTGGLWFPPNRHSLDSGFRLWWSVNPGWRKARRHRGSGATLTVQGGRGSGNKGDSHGSTPDALSCRNLGRDKTLLPIGARSPRGELPIIDGPAIDIEECKGTKMANTTLEALLADWRIMVETSLREHLASPEPVLDPYMGMMHYHMGWVDREFRPIARSVGKRSRPLLLLLACRTLGLDAEKALPAAVSVELLHAYSLLHDDIEDGDEYRRHSPTVWKIWGIPQAINVGDGLFGCTFRAMAGLHGTGFGSDTVAVAMSMLIDTSIALTEGQFLDIDFEQRTRLSLDDYTRMVQGKTAALFGTCLACGAHLSTNDGPMRERFRQLGEQTGIAYQMLDDINGIWADEDDTGKAPHQDIRRRKKSFPIALAFADRDIGERMVALYSRDMTAENVEATLVLLAAAGIKERCLHLYGRQLDAIRQTQEEIEHALHLEGRPVDLLEEFIGRLLSVPDLK
ncbi:MAG: polyprenyl synthetase family protein [Caldilineaceae bacterium SB0662_bin_9]|uniref:Polyprenyl synthetase family protein n=1 Tax=Caldilineaceae bacterium SB0662_bin_9 TaxID=2605258 RepID=A0A6B1DQ79_9CHLR|nr:polyprenyl synthetase family protein [Caldilineaceae bacterium SB0662_bin_9]